MLYTIIFGFILPWVLASFLVRKQPTLFIVISPITALISMTINTTGLYFGFWNIKPEFKENETISAMPLDMGLYAVLGSLLVFSLSKRILQLHPVVTFLAFSVFTTFMEFLALHFGIVSYSNGWNIGWTFISYSIAYLCVIAAWIIVRENVEVVK